MANDNGRESEFDPVLIPLSLIEALAASLFQALDNWQEERGIESMDTARCFVAMAAAVDAVMEHLSRETTGVTLQ